MSGTWISYADTRPQVAGIYRWRLPLVVAPGHLVTFLAHMRERNAGHRKELSPLFDHWDGYRLTVPGGTQWQPADTDEECKEYDYTSIAIENLASLPCIYCGSVPAWHGVQSSSRGGCFIGSAPHKFSSWWLECCRWGHTPHCKDPVELATFRNTALAELAKEEKSHD